MNYELRWKTKNSPKQNTLHKLCNFHSRYQEGGRETNVPSPHPQLGPSVMLGSGIPSQEAKMNIKMEAFGPDDDDETDGNDPLETLIENMDRANESD